MREDYLWDRSGPPDPEIERLETELASLRYRFVRPLPGARRQRAAARGSPWRPPCCWPPPLLFRGSIAPADPTRGAWEA
jgi:hypothetical protein